MEQFNDIESLFHHLEENATEYNFHHEIGNLFRDFIKSRDSTGQTNDKQKAQWEVAFFNFQLEEGTLKPRFSNTDESGNIVNFPDKESFTDETYEYLAERLNNSTNPLLKAIYSHILWCSPKKHSQYCQIAINSYLELIKVYEEKDKSSPEGIYGNNLLTAIINAFSLASQINYEIENVKTEMRRLIMAEKSRTSSFLFLQIQLIKWLLNGKRKFSRHDFNGLQETCWKMAGSMTNAGNIHGAIMMLQLGERIDHKLEIQTQEWKRQIAESYETLMCQRKDEPTIASLFCQLAIQYYKQVKDTDKVQELEKKYEEFKGSVTLQRYGEEVDLTEHIEECRKIAQEVIQTNSPEEIIKILMLDKQLLPKYKDLDRIVEEHDKQFIAIHIAPPTLLDENGHVAQHFTEEEEKRYYQILQQYHLYIHIDRIHLIHELFVAAISEKKLSTDTVLNFLRQHSWFGKNISKRFPNDVTVEYNWLNLIAPALQEFFSQMDYYLLNPGENRPNFVLFIDSLTLKIEGLIRDICRFSDVRTFYMALDEKQRNVSREKDVNRLFHEEKIKELLDEDDLLFFKFLLIEQAGYNLRNKVAHSLMLFQEYGVEYAYLLILALLRLGKYDFIEKTKGE